MHPLHSANTKWKFGVTRLQGYSHGAGYKVTRLQKIRGKIMENAEGVFYKGIFYPYEDLERACNDLKLDELMVFLIIDSK